MDYQNISPGFQHFWELHELNLNFVFRFFAVSLLRHSYDRPITARETEEESYDS